tara:strand:+ start:133 stop:510 length:378 start_codon:yes stop_codon:yes gene_type:complete
MVRDVGLMDLDVKEELKEALIDYENAMVRDYYSFTHRFHDPYKDKVRSEYANGIRYIKGPKYLKVINTDGDGSRMVHSFINLGNREFLYGDILKSAGWKAPALNKARGNLFKGYKVNWTGAEYLI